MKPKDALGYYEARITNRGKKAATGPTVPVQLDEMERIALWMIPEAFGAPTSKEATAEAQEILNSGVRGAGRSLLAKDAVISKAHVLYFGARLDHQVELLGHGKGDQKLARFYSDLTVRHHKMMMTSLELLLRMDTLPTSLVRVQAHRAAFVVNDTSSQVG